METVSSNSVQKTPLFVILGCSFSLFSFICGLIIGLVVLGWWLLPVQWVDLSPTDLRHEYQLIYLDMVVESFEQSNNFDQAKYRLDPWSEEEVLDLLDEAYDEAIINGSTQRANTIQLLMNSY